MIDPTEATRRRLLETKDRVDELETNQAGARFVKRAVDTGTPYTVTANDHVIEVDASGGPVTVNLPAVASTPAGRWLVIKDTGNATANNVTVDGSGAETIDGAATYVIAADYGSVTLWSDGSEWFTQNG